MLLSLHSQRYYLCFKFSTRPQMPVCQALTHRPVSRHGLSDDHVKKKKKKKIMIANMCMLY